MMQKMIIQFIPWHKESVGENSKTRAVGGLQFNTVVQEKIKEIFDPGKMQLPSPIHLPHGIFLTASIKWGSSGIKRYSHEIGNYLKVSLH